MSGFMWEADKQPNICEAASTFTFSSINLLIAIPMFLVDVVFNAVASLLSLIWIVLAPVVEYAMLACAYLSELLGLSELEQPSNLTMVAYLLAGGLVLGVYMDNKKYSQGSIQALISRGMNITTGVLTLLSVLYMPDFEDSVVLPKLITMAIICSAAGSAIRGMFREYYSYLKQEESKLRSFADGIIAFMETESVLFILMAAFGYPTFTQADDLTKYYCTIPFAAMLLIASKWERAEVPVSSTPLTNGSAVAVKEEEKTVVEEVAATLAEPAAIEKAEDKEADANAEPDEKEESAAAPSEDLSDAGEASEAVTNGQVVDEKKDAAEEPSKVIARVAALAAAIQGKVCFVVSPVLACAYSLLACTSRPLAAAYNLPWALICFFLVTNISFILEGVAWLHLTQNNLALALPVLSALVPPFLARYGDCITATCSYTSAMVEWLPYTGRACAMYLMVTNTVEL